MTTMQSVSDKFTIMAKSIGHVTFVMHSWEGLLGGVKCWKCDSYSVVDGYCRNATCTEFEPKFRKDE